MIEKLSGLILAPASNRVRLPPMTLSPHSFHIPVLGTGFTIDSPIKVARFGITSMISLVDDALIEEMRRIHATTRGKPYTPIRHSDDDCRARRITAYLNLVDEIVQEQMADLRRQPLTPDSELGTYFEMLPPGPLRQRYDSWKAASDPEMRANLDAELRENAVPGAIDVNIMTKLDRDQYRSGQKMPPEFSDALAALRGFARSRLKSSVEFSAGLNARLYTYASQFEDFLPDAEGRLTKRVILKVSDFRSAAIQGRFMAKRGLWISEYRIESGLNCGGHAFATQGELMGPILETFRERLGSLVDELLPVCNAALAARQRPMFPQAPRTDVSVQGGVGTAEEHAFLFSRYSVSRVGWGTPFLMVPEATNVDPDHLQRLIQAKDQQIVLSGHSPLGVPFWSLETSASEAMRHQRRLEGHPGSPCVKGYLATNTEFTPVPICTASRAYQKLKLEDLTRQALPDAVAPEQVEAVLEKSCICHDLGGGAMRIHEADDKATPAVCCGPNIVNFKKIYSLREMVDHIYGRFSALTRSDRPHMFVRELQLYRDHLEKEVSKASAHCSARTREHLAEFRTHLLEAIAYYRGIAREATRDSVRFLADLEHLEKAIQDFILPAAPLPAA